MRRRDFITLVGNAAAWPLTARAQQQAMPIVAVLDSVGALPAFRRGLSEEGYVVGRNVLLDVRATDQYDQVAALAIDLVSGRPSVLAALGGPAAPAAKTATSTLPIVFCIGGDPVELRLVASIARPGGNITGITFFSAELLQKQVGLMRELLPKARTFGVLVNPRNPRAAADLASVRAGAATIGVEVHAANVSAKSDFDGTFAALQSKHVDALLIAGDPLASRERKGLAEMALRHAIPAMYFQRQFPEGGGLISYGASAPDAYRQAGRYAGRILKGAKPNDLPVLQPTRFELVINLKTAKALGIEVPPTLLAIADEVIE